MNPTPEPAFRVSIIIPTWNEASTIEACLLDLRRQNPHEILVVDASSPDGTALLALDACAVVLHSPRGRGVQQNVGARAATGDIFLFLHSDCRLERGALSEISSFLRRNPRSSGGCLRMRVDDDRWAFRLIDAAAHVRAGVFGIPYGDQGIFVTRSAFDRVRGFPETSLMEDVLIALKLRRLGRVGLLRSQIRVSARRWNRMGLVRQTLLNWTLTLMAAAGVSTERLAKWYEAVR